MSPAPRWRTVHRMSESKMTGARRTLTVVCAAAVLAALGGTGGAVAARLIGSEQIADNSLRSVDVRDGDLALEDLGTSTRDSLSALNGYEVRWTRMILTGDQLPYWQHQINCPPGKVPLGAGQIVRGADVLASHPLLVDDRTSTRATGWLWRLIPTMPVDDEQDVYLYVTCATG